MDARILDDELRGVERRGELMIIVCWCSISMNVQVFIHNTYSILLSDRLLVPSY